MTPTEVILEASKNVVASVNNVWLTKEVPVRYLER